MLGKRVIKFESLKIRSNYVQIRLVFADLFTFLIVHACIYFACPFKYVISNVIIIVILYYMA